VRELIFSARKKDFRIDTFRAGGKGGQHQNKTDSGVRITHIETGLSAECRDGRSQHDNKKKAFRKLAAKLVEYVKQVERQVDLERSNEVVRTYHAVDNRVKDHATNKRSTYKAVVDGDGLEEMITARRLVRE